MSQTGSNPANQRMDGLYKSQLQEHCQRSSWPLPEYTTLKEGAPHSPYFKATVLVNGIPFQTLDFFKRAKDAQIEAAKIALAHFTSPAPAPAPAPAEFTLQKNSPAPEIKVDAQTGGKCPVTGTEGGLDISINLIKRPFADDTTTSIVEKCVQTYGKTSDTKRTKQSGEMHMYKNQLQSVVLKKGYNLPRYTFECEGPPHNCRFKSKVVINGQAYESPDFFGTLKESEHAAAKVALLSLAPLESQDASLDKSVFKNLLQEFAQKSGLKLPIYNTTGSGAIHKPTFVSTVVVGGETFFGEEAKTKKHAEMNAAKVAYTCLSQREILSPIGSAPNSVPQGGSASNLKALDTSDLGKTNQLGAASKLISSQGVIELPNSGYSNQEAPKRIPSCGGISSNSDGSPNMDSTTTLPPIMHSDLEDPLEYIPLSHIESYSPQAPSEVLHGSVSESNVGTSLRNVVRVYPRLLNMEIPAGAIVEHCDDKWIAVKFPVNQTSH